MVCSVGGIKPDPTKVQALKHIVQPNIIEELISFLCMMQLNANLLPNFAHKPAALCHLTKGRLNLIGQEQYQQCFEELQPAFEKHSLLKYFHMGKF